MKKRARNNWGGRREGAGRPRSARRARTHAHPSEPHKPRPAIAARQPLVVVARFVRAVNGNHVNGAVERALDLSRERADFEILELRVRRDAIHLVVEATDRRALARGMQGFQVSAARGINRAAKRRGTVFVDRYRANVRRA